MNELIKVTLNDNQEPVVSGRTLHKFLEITERYSSWFKRMVSYGFTEDIDYTGCKVFNTLAKQELQEHALKLDMAKELSMIQKTFKGKQARRYFIEVDNKFNDPTIIMARALKIADSQIHKLESDNSKLLIENTEMKPKAEYFDDLVDRKLLMNFRDTAKALKVKEREFINLLIEKKYVYRDKKKKLKPYATRKTVGLFEIKVAKNDDTGWKGEQTLITPKGVETFRNLVSEVA